MRFRKFSIFFLFVLWAPNLFAQTTDISGRYEGTADVQGLGKLSIKAEIRQKDGKLSGVVITPLGDAPVIDGVFANGVMALKIDAGGDDIFLNGKVEGGKISGEVSGAAAKGTFELKRAGDASPVIDNAVVLKQSKEKWREDLRFLADELPKRHKNAFHRISREQFEKLIAELDARIPALSDEEIILEMSRIASRIGDGHTGLSWSWFFPRVPMNLFWFGKELRVTKVDKKFPRLNGARLLKIGGVGVEKIYEQSREYIPQGETEQFTLDASAGGFISPIFLKHLGLTRNAESAVYEFLDLKGKRFSLEMKGVERAAKTDWIAPYKQAPLSMQKQEAPFYFEYLKDAKTVYVNFRWYPRRPEFAKFSKELFDFIDKTPIEKLVFDMRQNGGGDYTRGRDFFIKPLKERKKFAERGRLFVLAGRATYSAGMVNAADFRKEFNAIIVGEPTGARPIGYMEGRYFMLPNSHLQVGFSIELAKFAEADTPGILPDKLIEPDWKSFLNGRDTALEWVLAHPIQAQLFKEGETIIAEVQFDGLDSGDYGNPVAKPLYESDLRMLLRENRILIFNEAKYNSGEVEKAIKTLKEWTWRKGYINAEVVALGEKLKDNRMRLVFSVNRGSRKQVSEIRFAGNNSLTNDELVESMKNCLNDWETFDRRRYEYCAQRYARELMFEKGFFQAKIVGITPQFVSENLIVQIEVREGSRHRLGEIKIEGAKVFSPKEILEMLGQKTGDIANGRALREFCFEKLKKSYLNKGYIFYDCDIDPKFVEPKASGEDATVDILITIDEGKQFKIRKIEFAGIEQEKSQELKNNFSLQEGEVYVAEKLKNEIKKINDTGEFYFIDDERNVELRTDEEVGNVDIVINLKKIEP
ncbi:MAG TPA: POTRA domain-containing protein [Pyrinomonadaceae bacterium]|jgi:hypothetical protein